VFGVGTAGENVAAHGDIAIAPARFIRREIQLGLALVIAGKEAAASAPWVALALGRVVHENVVREDEVARLVDPSRLRDLRRL
jgi:hypothetical protein